MRMKTTLVNRITMLLAVLCISFTGLAESCLWKATSERGSFYLLGSVHFLKAADYPLAPEIEQAYAASELLLFETDMAQMLTPKTQQLLTEKAMLPGDRTLQGELDPDVYARLSEALDAAGLPPALCRRFKPWFATTSLMLLRMQAMGFDPAFGLDQHFHGRATADHKKELGLETVEFQINLFDALSEGNQNAYTRYALKELEQLETQLDQLLQAWKSGDIDRLDALVQESFREYPEMYKRFVTDRNRDWAGKIDRLADANKTCMVVVGVAHFAGSEGVLELMKKRGYAIEQL